ncbi:MAG: Gfo/Idh/MocA family oxidoreductase [Lentisphaeria bacterium]|nr:Gfo/Idh/MocA family oxidoreductase [Lentisphaeria bacterium]
MLKTCIIGISGYGRIHYDLLLQAQQAGKVAIVGATVINQAEEPDRCARLRALGCRIFDDYREMLRQLSGVAEFCMIPTGTPLHRPMTVAALEAGMHVLVEKPVAGCIEDVRAMQAAADSAGRTVAVGYQWLYTPAAQETKRHILQGTIGEVKGIKCLVMWPRNHDYYNRNGWAGKLSVDGVPVNDSPFNNAVAHDLMMMLFQAGATGRLAATPVSVEAELYRANAIESADTACMRIETAEGIPIRFYATHACRENFGPEIHIRGARGSIVISHNGSVIRPDEGAPIRYRVNGGEEARETMMASVLDALQGGDAFHCDLEMASRQTMVVSRIHETCAIQSVQGETVISQDDVVSTFIPGIEAAMRQAFDNETMLRLSVKGVDDVE